MLNPEKILGGLLRGRSRRGGMLGTLGAGTIGLGLLGVAMEAAEHYMNKSKTAQSAGVPPAPPAAGPAAPPPPPGASSDGPPPPPAAGRPAAADTSGDAVLLIRAMIAAANADGTMDEEERGRILNRLKEVQLTPEEHAFIVQELLSPCDLDTIVKAVTSPETARQVYAVSLMAIEVDTDAERRYIQGLSRRLGLDADAVSEIQRELGGAPA
ncbi:MAG: tellurite resistance TerB family protein [Desulfobacterales bacterium]|nr:MAG: tellurite resistance TerB family protein [Desulfobacterales bacterium]